MAIRADTYAFARRVPYLLERGVVQTVQAPIRQPSDGALVAPDSGTLTVVRPDGSSLVSAAAVTITSSVASYDLTPAATETLGAGWELRWTLVIGGVTYPTYRQSGYLCEYVPSNVVGPADLYGVLPWLQHRVPQSQGSRGDNTGWQRQIDDAYYALIRRLLDNGREPWNIVEVTGYYEWLLAKALQNCLGAIERLAGDEVAEHNRQAHFRLRQAEAALRIQVSDDVADYRRGGSPVIRLAPVGRASW